ncbi:dTDP-4-dehydrorhamnose reductase [Pustulibacterium marinum]|uniref:dTDP-4-dehydrorhamnose reductase n=1 Tax=Pustulibacterium marinum TaxID=1224947 RepID=A0A1I7G2A1_9FLAO|nr:sugar nucleotide-binding protein [Pustulibacterium marinum]SFU42557.1 dTDP-4-dehydrorhamnose reductase [Pustulibacterium marinum]
MNRILILGASGFIGNTIYKELCSYYDVYGTYRSKKSFRKNQHFIRFDMDIDGVDEVLKEVKPHIIISALRGDFDEQIAVHDVLIDYVKNSNRKIIFLSSANVFDAFTNFPSYEMDKTLSESKWGRLKIRIENKLLRIPEKNYCIARVPMVFGTGSPRVQEILAHHKLEVPYEVFPDLVMNTTYADKLAQQIHYMVNRNKKGIFHLGSTDLIHHNEFIEEICKGLQLKNIVFKNVYTSNYDRFLAVIPKDNKLPKHLQLTTDDVLKDSIKFS